MKSTASAPETSRQPAESQGGRPPKTAELALAKFDKLPGSGAVPAKTACDVLSIGASTLRRLARHDSRLAPIRLNARCVRYSVKGIRAYLAGGEAK